MRLRPDDTPPMELNEVRRFSFPLAGAVGVNSINTATITGPNLTFGTPSISGTTVNVTCTAGATGTHMAKLSCELSSSETIISVLRVKVVDSTCETNRRDY